jgi:hypothetical protein
MRLLRAHARWARSAALATPASGGRLLSRGELVSWSNALDHLLNEVKRLRAQAEAEATPTTTEETCLEQGLQ